MELASDSERKAQTGDIENQIVPNHSNQPDGEKSDDTGRHDGLHRLKTLNQSVGLTWKNLTYSVKDKHNKGQTKNILSDISGYVEPGKVLCILGPSGCGKTTLLQVLGGLRTPTKGEIYYLGKSKRETKVSDDIMGYDGNAAYIAQEDVLYGSLTCREVLYYAAKLKAGKMSNDEINELVDNTLEYLGLKSCADALIGNMFLKGVSGGQKRRVSIGIELMGQPNLLFMDEITSGLDSTSTYKLMNVVALLAQKGHTIVMTIHQPSSRVYFGDLYPEFQFNCRLLPELSRLTLFTVSGAKIIHKPLCDFRMMVLESGRTMYFGKVSELPGYLEKKMGFEIPKYSNPCDYILDKVNCDFQESSEEADNLHQYFNDNVREEVMQKIEGINKTESEVQIDPKSTKFVLQQIWVLLCKNFRNHLRNYAIYWVRIAMYSMLCVCLGTLYWDIGTGIDDQQDRISILFFVAAFLTFMSISGMPAFCEERGIYLRERANNHYSTFAYSIANFLSSMPWIFLIALISSTLIYLMIQSRSGGDKFAIYLMNLFTVLMTAESLMVAISAISSIFMVGLALGAGICGLFMIVCGFFLLPSNIPAFWKGISYISFHTYSFRIFMRNEFHDFNEGEIDGNQVLEFYEMEDADIGLCFMALIIMLLVYRFVFYLLLRFWVRKQK